MNDEVLAWLSVWSEVQMIYVWSSSCFIKIQNGVTFLMPAYPRCPGKEAVKRVSYVATLLCRIRVFRITNTLPVLPSQFIYFMWNVVELYNSEVTMSRTDVGIVWKLMSSVCIAFSTLYRRLCDELCWQKPTDFLQLMVNAYIDDSETDEVSVDEYTGTVIRWSHKGTWVLAGCIYCIQKRTTCWFICW